MSSFLVRLSALLFSTATSASRAMMTSGGGGEREEPSEVESKNNLGLFSDSPEKHHEIREMSIETIGHIGTYTRP